MFSGQEAQRQVARQHVGFSVLPLVYFLFRVQIK